MFYLVHVSSVRPRQTMIDDCVERQRDKIADNLKILRFKNVSKKFCRKMYHVLRRNRFGDLGMEFLEIHAFWLIIIGALVYLQQKQMVRMKSPRCVWFNAKRMILIGRFDAANHQFKKQPKCVIIMSPKRFLTCTSTTCIRAGGTSMRGWNTKMNHDMVSTG